MPPCGAVSENNFGEVISGQAILLEHVQIGAGYSISRLSMHNFSYHNTMTFRLKDQCDPIHPESINFLDAMFYCCYSLEIFHQ